MVTIDKSRIGLWGCTWRVGSSIERTLEGRSRFCTRESEGLCPGARKYSGSNSSRNRRIWRSLIGNSYGSIYGIAYVSSSIDFLILDGIYSDEGGVNGSACLEGSGRVIRSREGIARSIDIVCP